MPQGEVAHVKHQLPHHFQGLDRVNAHNVGLPDLYTNNLVLYLWEKDSVAKALLLLDELLQGLRECLAGPPHAVVIKCGSPVQGVLPEAHSMKDDITRVVDEVEIEVLCLDANG